jgi:hypothetical protein
MTSPVATARVRRLEESTADDGDREGRGHKENEQPPTLRHVPLYLGVSDSRRGDSDEGCNRRERLRLLELPQSAVEAETVTAANSM